MKRLITWFKDEEGQGMVEYALIVGLIAIVVVIALSLIGNSIRDRFEDITGKLTETAAP